VERQPCAASGWRKFVRIGGTNAHVVLEEAPVLQISETSRPAQLLLFSAKSEASLDVATANLAEHLKQNPALNLADAAYTLQLGRHEFSHRRMLVCHSTSDAISALEHATRNGFSPVFPSRKTRPSCSCFPPGRQQVNMARELYGHEPAFREQVDLCCEILKPQLEVQFADDSVSGRGQD